jgi:ligand-binding sensor domain-containing protein/signal transduction histidine kinase
MNDLELTAGTHDYAGAARSNRLPSPCRGSLLSAPIHPPRVPPHPPAGTTLPKPRGAAWLKLGLALSLVCCGSGALAANKAIAPEFLLRTWDSEDGLPAAAIRDIARTPEGYVWIATTAGLARFDGVRFTVFTTNEAPGLGDNRISCLATDASGDLWVGSEAGTLARRRQGVFVTVPLDERISQKRIHSLASDRKGGVWLATAGAGLVHWSQGRCDFGALTNGLPETDVSQAVTDLQGGVWARANGRPARLGSNRWETVELPRSSGSAAGLAAARDGGVCLATIFSSPRGGNGGTVLSLKEGMAVQELAPHPWREGSAFPTVSALLEDSQGGIWLGTGGSGLLRWAREGGWQSFLTEGLPHQPSVSCLSQDEAGSIWAGFGRSDQLTQVRPRLVKTLSLPKPWEQSRVYAVCAAQDSSIWVGTSDAGVFRYQNGNFDHFGAAEGLTSGVVSVILEDRHTNLWVGASEGLFRLNGERFELIQRGRIITLHEDRRGALWVGTLMALLRAMPGQKTASTNEMPKGLGAAATALAEDNGGRLWAGTMRHGLFYLNGERFEAFQTNNQELAGADMRALAAGRDGSLWVGTLDSGLFRVREGVVSHWTKADGLPNDRCLGVIEDASGNMWFSSDNGLFGASPAHFDTYVPGKSPPMVFWHLSTEDGMASRLGSRAGWPCVARSGDGRLWFPNQSVVAIIDPQKLDLGRNARPALIEEVVVDGTALCTGGGGPLSVPSGARRFEIHYTSASLQAPERNQFRYRLRGWDEDWVAAGRHRVAYYGHLPPGQYQFQVMAAGAEGGWREARPELSLVIVPRVWERPWVQIAGAVALLAAVATAVWGFTHARLERRMVLLELRQSTERERRRIAQDLHDDLGTSLTEISLLSTVARSSSASPEAVKTRLGSIADKAVDMVKALDEIVWAVNPKNDSVASLVHYLCLFVQEFLEPTGIRVRLEVPPELPQSELNAEQRHTLFLVVKEAVANSAKHAAASQVSLRVAVEDGWLELSLEDNGRGFDPAHPTPGRNGMENMRTRMARLGGQCEVQSQPGEGTRLRIRLRLP